MKLLIQTNENSHEFELYEISNFIQAKVIGSQLFGC
jgi:hypothetical protein